MTTVGGFVVCSFDSGVTSRQKRSYAEFRDAVVRAGRFSCFEATATMRDAKLYTRLEMDPEVVVTTEPYPWSSVRMRTAEDPRWSPRGQAEPGEHTIVLEMGAAREARLREARERRAAKRRAKGTQERSR